MDSNLLVSILMPIFKVEQYLGRTLDSIFTQSYPNLEYVFVNDCSPDNSLQVLEKSIEQHQIPIGRYTIINHLQNEGIAVSRADCISRAKGDYFFFVDSDDWIEADTVEKVCRRLSVSLKAAVYRKRVPRDRKAALTGRITDFRISREPAHQNDYVHDSPSFL